MSKKRPSLDARAEAAALQRHDVTTRAKRKAAPAAPKNRPHTSLYISAGVKRALRRTAAELDIKTHDLVLEGIDLVLRNAASYAHSPTQLFVDRRYIRPIRTRIITMIRMIPSVPPG